MENISGIAEGKIGISNIFSSAIFKKSTLSSSNMNWIFQKFWAANANFSAVHEKEKSCLNFNLTLNPSCWMFEFWICEKVDKNLNKFHFLIYLSSDITRMNQSLALEVHCARNFNVNQNSFFWLFFWLQRSRISS